MKLVIKKNPNAWTLIERLDLPDGAPTPSGYEDSTPAAAQAWVDAQLAGGWVPAAPPPPALFAEGVDAARLRIALVTQGWVSTGTPANPGPDIDAWALAHINALATPAQRGRGRLRWQYTSFFAWDDELIRWFANRDGKTNAQRRDLFIAASTA